MRGAGLAKTKVTRRTVARVIAVEAVGDVAADDVVLVTPELAKVFGVEVVVTPPMPLPRNALDPRREQYLARTIIDELARRKRTEWDRLLGVVGEDLYAPGLNFVFGEADAQRGVAVFSLARLRSGPTSPTAVAQFRRRAAIEGIHEIGHTYGLDHCEDPRCVMWFSNTLAETDRKGSAFCAKHQAQLVKRL